MRTLNTAEMRNVNGGKTYTYKCKYCGKKFKGNIFNWFIMKGQRNWHQKRCQYFTELKKVGSML